MEKSFITSGPGHSCSSGGFFYSGVSVVLFDILEINTCTLFLSSHHL